MEGALNHLLHAIVLSIILYGMMRYILKQSQTMSLNRSLLVGAVALIYMILFGHRFPSHLNKI